MSEDSARRQDSVLQATYDEYEFVVACKKCGVVDEFTLTKEQASGIHPIDGEPAREHYERTGHTAGSLNFTTAPPDIREMLDGGRVDDLDWSRIAEWLQHASEVDHV